MFSYNFDFGFIVPYWGTLLSGLFVTLELAISMMFLSTSLATIFGVLMTNENKLVRNIVMLLVDIIRSMPLIVLILICYYAFPIFGIYVNPFWPALFALTLDAGAFLGDIIRGSIEGIPKGGVLAAKVLGMDRQTIIRRIILPEVIREVLPTVTLGYISMIKWTSLASGIAVYELTHVGNWIISSTFKPLEVYLTVATIYIAIILPLTRLSRKFEKSSYFKRRSI